MSILRCVLRGAVFGLAGLGACAPIRYSVQEVVLRPDAKADALEVMILYGGIQTAPQDHEDDLAVAQRFVARVALGAREFMLVDWPGHHDLDEIEKKARKHPLGEKDPWAGWQREGLECLSGIRVVASGFYADDKNRPSLYQRFRIESASRLVDLFNSSLHLWIEERASGGTLQKETPLLDDKTRDAWTKLAKQKTRWLSLKDGGIELSLPLTRKAAAKVVSGLMQESAKDPMMAKILAYFAGSLEEVQFSEDHVRLRWASGGGLVRFRLESAGDYDERLSKDLRSSKEFPEHLPSLEDVMRIFTGS